MQVPMIRRLRGVVQPAIWEPEISVHQEQATIRVINSHIVTEGIEKHSVTTTHELCEIAQSPLKRA